MPARLLCLLDSGGCHRLRELPSLWVNSVGRWCPASSMLQNTLQSSRTGKAEAACTLAGRVLRSRDGPARALCTCAAHVSYPHRAAHRGVWSALGRARGGTAGTDGGSFFLCCFSLAGRGKAVLCRCAGAAAASVAAHGTCVLSDVLGLSFLTVLATRVYEGRARRCPSSPRGRAAVPGSHVRGGCGRGVGGEWCYVRCLAVFAELGTSVALLRRAKVGGIRG